MTTHPDVSINDDLSPCEPGVTHGTTYYETSSGIDVVLGVRIEQMLRKRSLDYLLEHFSAQAAIVYRFGMLRRDHDRIHANGLVVGIVFDCDLGFAVRPEEIEGTAFANF